MERPKSLPHYFVANALTETRSALSLGAAIAGAINEPIIASVLLVSALGTEIDGRIARKGKAATRRGDHRDNIADITWRFCIYGNAFLFMDHQLKNFTDSERIVFSSLLFGFSTLLSYIGYITRQKPPES